MTRVLTAPWCFLYRFWTVPIRAEPVALFRISLGTVTILAMLMSLGLSLDLYAGPDGLVPPEAARAWEGSGRPSLLLGPTNLPFGRQILPEDWKASFDDWLPKDWASAWTDWGETKQAVYLLFTIWMLSLLSMTVGFWTRTSTILAWVLTITFHTRIIVLVNGGDDMISNGMYYLLFAPSGRAWSLDSYFRRRREDRLAAAAGKDLSPSEPAMIAPWSVRLIQIQLCLIYCFTGLSKLLPNLSWGDPCSGILLEGSNDWIDGTAVYWTLNDFSLTRFPYHYFPVPLFICKLLSWATLVWEIGFPLLVSIRQVRPWVLALGVLFHAGIFVHTEVGWFSPLTLCWYAVFLPGDKLVRFYDRCRKLLAGLGKQPNHVVDNAVTGC